MGRNKGKGKQPYVPTNQELAQLPLGEIAREFGARNGEGRKYFAIFRDGRYTTLRMFKRMRNHHDLALELARIVLCFPHEARQYAAAEAGH